MVRQYATFYIDEGLFGIDVLLINEVNRNVEITEVSPAPDYVKGLINLRGQIVAVIDPGVRFGIGKRSASTESCCVVLKSQADTQRLASQGLIEESKVKDPVAILADRIGDMVVVNDENIERAPANVNGVDAAFMSGVVKLESGLLVIIKVSKLIEATV